MQRPIFLFLIAFLLAAPAGAAPAAADADHDGNAPPVLIPQLRPLIVHYDIYVGGVHFITADVLFSEQNRKYHTLVQAHTYGFWYKAFPWDSSLDVNGALSGDRFVPADFVTHDIWGKKARATMMHFQPDGDIATSFDPPSHDEDRDAVTKEQRIGSLDPVTGLLQMLAHVSIKKDCDVMSPVFDGKHRFDITGSDGGADDIDEGDYSAYKGPARVCSADFKMVAGEWKDRHTARFWDHGSDKPGRDPFRIWMASLAPGLPELPVRLESGSVLGLLVVHLSKWNYAASSEFKP